MSNIKLKRGETEEVLGMLEKILCSQQVRRVGQGSKEPQPEGLVPMTSCQKGVMTGKSWTLVPPMKKCVIFF